MRPHVPDLDRACEFEFVKRDADGGGCSAVAIDHEHLHAVAARYRV